MTETKRVLDADVYDTLELAAEAYGGVGTGWMFDYGQRVTTPCCIHGLASFAECSDALVISIASPIRNALYAVGITGGANDSIFGDDEERIPFAEWCKRLGVERGSDV